MKKLLHTARGLLSLCLYVVNTLFCCTPLFAVTLLKLAVPAPPFRRVCDRALNSIASAWVRINISNQTLFSRTRLRVTAALDMDPRGWYLVMANHQSWVDILVLQRIFHNRIPMLKFFLKKELIWVPVLGLAWWALDFPFMKRYSKAFLEKHPHLRGRDIEITRRACRKFKTIPVSIVNFVEGTRFTAQKHGRQKSPYTHLLRTKAGGIAFVMAAMGEQLHTILDVTIAYPERPGSFWAFICGEIPEIRIDIRSMPVTPSLVGNYALDETFRQSFQRWLNRLWVEKDARMSGLLAAPDDKGPCPRQNEDCLPKVA